MPEAPLPSADKSASGAKPAPPHAAVLGDAKVTIEAPAFRVFAALTNQDEVATWFGDDVIVEPDEGGRYETTLSGARVEGTITAIDGPQTLVFTWPIESGGNSIVTSVHCDLAPMGPRTAVHIAHRAPLPVAGNWSELWASVLAALKDYVEGASPPEAG